MRPCCSTRCRDWRFFGGWKFQLLSHCRRRWHGTRGRFGLALFALLLTGGAVIKIAGGASAAPRLDCSVWIWVVEGGGIGKGKGFDLFVYNIVIIESILDRERTLVKDTREYIGTVTSDTGGTHRRSTRRSYDGRSSSSSSSTSCKSTSSVARTIFLDRRRSIPS